MSFTSFMIRRTFKKGDDKRDAGLTTPENVVRYDDIMYGLYPNGKKDMTSLLMKDLLPHKGTKEEVEQLCVTKHLTGAFPPSFVMTAEGDFLGVQAKPLADHLNSLGVQAEYHYYGDKEHVLGHVFHRNMRSEFAKQCNKEECAFFQSFLDN